jgi:hypothetical protein
MHRGPRPEASSGAFLFFHNPPPPFYLFTPSLLYSLNYFRLPPYAMVSSEQYALVTDGSSHVCFFPVPA